MASPILTDADIAEFDRKQGQKPPILTDADIQAFDRQNSTPQPSTSAERPINPIEIAGNTALDPFLAPIGLSSSQRQMQSMYQTSKENILESDPMKSMRSGFSAEKAPINRAVQFQNPVVGAGIEVGNQPPQKLVREAQGLGVDAVAGVGGDVLAAKGPGVVGNLLKKIGGGAEELAGRFLNSYIKPRQAAYSFGRNPGKTVAKYIGPTANRDSLLNKIVETKENLLGKLEEAARNSTEPVDVTPIFQEIASQMTTMSKLPRTYKPQIETHSDLAMDLKDIIEQNSVVKDGKIFVNPQKAIQIKRLLGELPSWAANDPKLGTISKTSRKAYGKFDREIDKSIKGAEGLNDDVSNLIGAEQGVKLGQQREQNKNPILNLPNMLLGLGGFFGSGGNPAGAGVAIAGSEILRGAPFNTTTGSTLSKVGGGTKNLGKAVGALERKPLVQELIGELLKSRGPKSLVSIPQKPTQATPQKQNLAMLARNRKSEISRALPDYSGGDVINVEGSSTIEIPETLESDFKRLAKKFGVPEFRNVRSYTSEFKKVPRGSIGKNLKELLRRRSKNQKP